MGENQGLQQVLVKLIVSGREMVPYTEIAENGLESFVEGESVDKMSTGWRIGLSPIRWWWNGC